MHAVTAIAGVTEITTLAVFKVNFLPYQFNNEMVRVINVLKYTADSNESCIAVGFYSGHSLLIKFSNVEKMVKEHHKHPIFVYPPIMEDADLVMGRFFWLAFVTFSFIRSPPIGCRSFREKVLALCSNTNRREILRWIFTFASKKRS